MAEPPVSMPGRQDKLERLRQQVEAETGMDFAGARLVRLESAVDKILARHHGADIDRFLARSEEHPALMESLTAELTVGESFFFRNEYHFNALREHVLPEILRDHAAQREIRIWSAGCSTGEEPYSLAIALDQVAAGGMWHFSILGTDLNLAFLERARQGRYRQWSFRQTEIHQDSRYFAREGEWFTLAEQVRKQVRFAYLNLVKDVYPSALTGTLGLDLILFRNVAIYLKPEVSQGIVERFRRALRPGGWLLLGEVELSLTPTSGFEAVQFEQATFLRKPLGTQAEWVAPAPVLHAPAGLQVPSLPQWGPLPWTSTEGAAARSKLESEMTLWEQVERHVQAKEFAEAERVLERITPTKERARQRLRYVGSLLGVAESGRAREMLEVCLKEEPLLIEGQLWKASFAEEAGDLALAEQAYRKALYIDRHCPMAHFQLALVLQRKGDEAAMRRSLRTTLELIKDRNPQATVEYGEGLCCGRLREMADLMLQEEKGAPK